VNHRTSAKPVVYNINSETVMKTLRETQNSRKAKSIKDPVRREIFELKSKIKEVKEEIIHKDQEMEVLEQNIQKVFSKNEGKMKKVKHSLKIKKCKKDIKQQELFEYNHFLKKTLREKTSQLADMRERFNKRTIAGRVQKDEFKEKLKEKRMEILAREKELEIIRNHLVNPNNYIEDYLHCFPNSK